MPLSGEQNKFLQGTNELNLAQITRQENNTLAYVVYGLQALAVFTALPFLLAAIINYVKYDSVIGTLSETHFRWQIRTFWFSLLWGIIGGIFTFLFFGYGILALNYLWVIYRILKGWLRLNAGMTMYSD
jgi:uncharacterized membrane protein